jgi:hypothetical protein
MRAHYAAVKARLQADAALTDKVFDSARIDADGNLVRDQYLILFGSPGSRDTGRLTAAQSATADASFDYTIRAVSVSVDGCFMLLEKVYAQLAGFVPTIAGRYCNPISLDGSGFEVEPDMSVSPPLYSVDVDVTLASSPI